MTKRKPWCADGWRQAVATCVGLFLLLVAGTAEARSTVVRHERATAHATSRHAQSSRAGKKPVRPAVRGTRALGRNQRNRDETQAASEVFAAELKDDQETGLHGLASFYAYGFHGRRTATGEVFRVQEFTAASNRFPLGTMVAVRRLDNNLCAIVKVNDRMHAKHRKRIIDVSRGVAEYLDMIRAGVVLVSVAPLKPGWREQEGGLACKAAFEALPECPDCPPKTPELPPIQLEPVPAQ